MASCAPGDAIAVIANSTAACKLSDDASHPMPLTKVYTDANWEAMLLTLESSKKKGQNEDGVGKMALKKHVTYRDPYGPEDPLLHGEPHWQFKPVDISHHLGFWARDEVRSTPRPLPISVALGWSGIIVKLYESIPGVELRMAPNGKQVLVVAVPSWVPEAFKHHPLVEHTEPFNLDGTTTSWNSRRDLKVGKTVGQVFMTTDDILILRVKMYSFFSKKPDMMSEDYLWNGVQKYGPQAAMVTKSCAWDIKRDIRAHHFCLGLPEKK